MGSPAVREKPLLAVLLEAVPPLAQSGAGDAAAAADESGVTCLFVETDPLAATLLLDTL